MYFEYAESGIFPVMNKIPDRQKGKDSSKKKPIVNDSEMSFADFDDIDSPPPKKTKSEVKRPTKQTAKKVKASTKKKNPSMRHHQ
uniref:Uncharacterized protein n=1 Tax=Panagrolaimus sp. ES5 TaxID=591445 RepID=A0AC34FIY0_9BILA